MNEPQWIAATDVVFVEPDGARVAGKIQIGLPGPSANGSEAQCSYNLEPIATGRPIYGADNLQALLLALRMCGVELALFERRGGRIEYPPAEDGSPGPPWEASATFGAFFRVPS